MNENQVVNMEEITEGFVQDKYGMYLRKSRADLELEALGEEETLARHKARLYALAEKMGITPDQIEIYHELVSGDSIQERPEMQRLLNDVYSQKYKGVFAVEVERLARGNTKDQGEVADAFQYSGTNIITPQKVYNPHNESDMEYFEFGLFMSRREFKTITRRMSAGKLQAVQEGNYISSAKIYGYEAVRVSKKERVLQVIPEEAKLVQMIFDWFTIDRKSIGWISTELTNMGIPTYKKKPEWNRGTIRTILSNEHYIGLVRWNQKKTVKEFDAETGKVTKVRKQAEKELYPGKHKAIISKEQFDYAQTLFRSYTPAKIENIQLRNPYAGILKCRDCGKSMVAIVYPEKYNRQVRIKHQQYTKCKCKSVPLDTISESLVETLKSIIDDYEIKLQNGNEQADIQRHDDMIEAMQKELEKQKQKRSRLFDAYEEDEAYTKEEFLERKQIVNAKIEAITAKIQEAKENAPDPIDYESKIISIHKLIDTIKDDSIPVKPKNDFLKQYIERIDINIVDLGYRFGGKPEMDIYLK